MIVDLAKMALLAAALPSAFRLVPPCLQVATGPFAGMLVGRRAWGSCFAAKVVGTYEMELRPVLAYIADRPITRFVDVGAAEGYYAIGLCKAMPSLRSVLAFEAEEQGCATLRRNVKANALVDRVEIGKECGQSELAMPSAMAAASLCSATSKATNRCFSTRTACPVWPEHICSSRYTRLNRPA